MADSKVLDQTCKTRQTEQVATAAVVVAVVDTVVRLVVAPSRLLSKALLDRPTTSRGPSLPNNKCRPRLLRHNVLNVASEQVVLFHFWLFFSWRSWAYSCNAGWPACHWTIRLVFFLFDSLRPFFCCTI
jgi:hypothetical protein